MMVVVIVPQTREEKLSMYMKCTKRELAEMLVNRDMLDQELRAGESIYPRTQVFYTEETMPKEKS